MIRCLRAREGNLGNVCRVITQKGFSLKLLETSANNEKRISDLFLERKSGNFIFSLCLHEIQCTAEVMMKIRSGPRK